MHQRSYDNSLGKCVLYVKVSIHHSEVGNIEGTIGERKIVLQNRIKNESNNVLLLSYDRTNKDN